MKKWFWRLLIAVAMFSAGFAVSSVRDYYAQRFQIADEALRGAKNNSYLTIPWLLKCGIPQHREILRSEISKVYWYTDLGKVLAEPWGPRGDDNFWGLAFAILRDPGPKGWSYQENMSDGQQDEMIRYLCFRVAATSFEVGPDNIYSEYEFQALTTYPPASLERNAKMLTNMMKGIIRTPYSETIRNAFTFLAAHAAEEWVGNFVLWFTQLGSYGEHGMSQRGDNFVYLLRALREESQAKGNKEARALYLRVLNEPSKRRAINNSTEVANQDWKNMLTEEGLTP